MFIVPGRIYRRYFGACSLKSAILDSERTALDNQKPTLSCQGAEAPSCRALFAIWEV